MEEKLEIFDTHCHINVDAFEDDVDEVIQRAEEAGVTRLAVVGFDQASIQRALELKNTYDQVYAIVGCHPTEAASYTEGFEESLRQIFSTEDKVIALGEIGLDYYWMEDPKEVQAEVFRRQIQLAKEVNRPIVIHNREATADTYAILKDEGLPQAGGIMHSFGETAAWAEKFLDLGMHLSFSGVATFKKTDDVREAARLVPDDRILVETDSPYLSPEPKRGKRNEPAYTRYVAERLAEERGQSLRDFARMTTANALRLFQLEDA